MSGQDILDQAAGTTAFVHDYLHIDWDGTEVQNDKADRRGARRHRQPGHRRHRHGADRPHACWAPTSRTRSRRSRPATAAFTDDTAETDALTVADGAYKVVFLAFPFEAYGIGHAEGRPDEPGLHLVRFVTPAVCP